MPPTRLPFLVSVSYSALGLLVGLVLSSPVWVLPALLAQQPPAIPATPTQTAPELPEGLSIDGRLSWRPALKPTAAITVDAAGVITDWRAGAPKVIPAGGREELIVALEQLQNNSGEWVGVLGRHGMVRLGDKTGAKDGARPEGFSGLSIVGLDQADPSSSDYTYLAGAMISQRVGIQRDLAFLNLTFDCTTDRPFETLAGQQVDPGNFYLERVRFLAISNSAQGLTPKGSNSSTFILKHHGGSRLHLLGVDLLDGAEVGDGWGGSSQHFLYSDGCFGDSEFIDCRLHGCKISALYFATRYQNRIQTGPNTWVERYAKGRLLIENLSATDCGVLGSWAVNICGGFCQVVVRNYHYRVNLDGYDLAGQVPGAKWAGGALQAYVDAKQYELDYTLPINSNSQPIALGYSMDPPGGSLPASPGAAAMGLPSDGYGGARSIEIVGGTFEGAAIYPPLINLRDVKLVALTESAAGCAPFTVRGVGKTLAFGSSGISSQCGPAEEPGKQPGSMPAVLAGWNQQARFLSRRPASSWIGGAVKVNGVTVPPADLDTWAWSK
jgi:hypothetical protein